VAQVNPNIYDCHWVRCNSRGYSAARIVRYLTRRPVEKGQALRGAGWRELPEEKTFGDAEAFKAAANRRRRERLARARELGCDISQDHSPRNVQYLHVVLSPSRRHEFADEDFGALLEPWVRDGNGRVREYFAAIHDDDPEGPKIHLVVARVKLSARELPLLKERTARIIRERERLIDIDLERPNDRSRPLPREPERTLRPERDILL
jgi:hypothetical protein